MKKRAILYIRVSTDDQKNGYSPQDQEERLIKYCSLNNIDIVGIYHEDESAKDFENRPEWQNILRFIKQNKNSVDTILFAKWDRFSRNVAEAYITIRELRKLGVEPQAMEQPLDFEIPESKIMLAVYLATPEVDNDRRSLNTFNGMRKAKKEGRWIARPLWGYKLSRDEKNKAIMIPDGGKRQEIIIKAFTEFATGLYTVDELWNHLSKDGLTITKKHLWSILRNKSYIGKICVPAFKDEPEEWRDALHEPLISDNIFYSVQDILDGRRKAVVLKYTMQRNELPLRGYLLCPQCGGNLTGSASKGASGMKFFYYHCTKGCKERKRATEINERFVKILRAFNYDKAKIKLAGEIIKRKLNTNSEEAKKDISKLANEIEKQKVRLSNARTLMLDGEISSGEYKEIKIKIEETLSSLTRQQNSINVNDEKISEEIDFVVSLIQNIDVIFDNSGIITQRHIISSIFPEKLTFEKEKCRTTKIEEAILFLCLSDKQIEGLKKEQHPISEMLLPMVAGG